MSKDKTTTTTHDEDRELYVNKESLSLKFDLIYKKYCYIYQRDPVPQEGTLEELMLHLSAVARLVFNRESPELNDGLTWLVDKMCRAILYDLKAAHERFNKKVVEAIPEVIRRLVESFDKETPPEKIDTTVEK